MQSKISFFNTTIFKKNLTHFWPIWSLYLAFMLFMMPVNIFFCTNSTYDGYTQTQIAEMRFANYVDCTNMMMSPIICIAVAIIVAMAVFSYLYNVRSSQMFHSLPIKRETMFITNYLTGLIFILVPIILAFLASVVVCALQGITSLEYLFVWVLCMAGMSFFFYSMAVLVGMFTGFLLAVPVLTILLNFLYIGCKYMVTSLIGMIGYGLSESYASRSVSILSPLYFLTRKLSLYTEYDADGVMVGMTTGTKYVAIYALVGVVFLVIAFLMYRKRRIETTGDMLSINAVKPVFRWGFALCVATLGTMIIGSFLPTNVPVTKEFVIDTVVLVVIGLIAFFIAQMILEKQAKVFHKKRFLECGVFLVLSVLFMVCIEKNMFGLETRLPDVEDVEYAQLYMYYPIYESDEQGIAEIEKIHKQIIASKREFEKYQSKTGKDNETIHVEVRYRMKNGETIVRSYSVPADDSYKADETSVVSVIGNISRDVENFLTNLICLNYKDITIRNASVSFYDEKLNYEEVTVEDDEAESVYEAVLKDIRDGNIAVENNSDYYYYEQSDKTAESNYANTLTFNIWCDNGIQTQNWWNYYGYQEGKVNGQKEGSFAVNINDRCTYTLEALAKAGMTNDEHELITYKQYNEYGKEVYGDEWY